MQDTLSRTFSALADPTRRAILARLRQGEATVGQLAEPFLGQMTLPGITKHLKVLETAGLVTKGREAQWRPCKLNPEPLKHADQWLAEYLEQRVSSQEVFVIARAFDAPVATVFDAWTTPAQLAAWLPPTGFIMTYQHADVRSGGETRFSLHNADFQMHVRQHYLDVRRPDLLRYVQSFTDAQGNLSRQPGSPHWPEYNVVTVQFFAEGPAHSRVVVRFAVDGEVTPVEMAAFTAERTGMMMGWNGSFDALDLLLERAAASQS